MSLRLCMAAALFGLAGCATQQPFSYIDGNKWHRAEMNSFSVLVLDIDGKSSLQHPVVVDPGLRVIRVQAPPGTRLGRGEDRSFTLDVKPCTHYYLKAVKKNPLLDDFEPMVDYETPIVGCNPNPTKGEGK